MVNNFNPSLNLRLIRRCPICNIEYKQSMIQVLDENEFGLLTYATCNSCGSNLLTKFSSLPQGVVGNAILTDLKSEEVLEFAAGDDISDDDVLYIQQAISKKDLINKFKDIQ